MARKDKRNVELTEEEEVLDTVDNNEEEIVSEEPNSRASLLSVAMHKLAGLKSDQLVAFFNDSIAKIGTESDPIPDGTAERNRASVAMKGAVAEDLEKIFGADKNLSEDFKANVSTLFEAAVGARIALIEAEIQDAYATALQEQVEAISEQMVNDVDAYISRIAEDWLEDNQVAIEKSLRHEIAESFMQDFVDLLRNRWVDIPEDRVDIAEALNAKNEEYEELLDELIKENRALAEIIASKEKAEIVSQMSEGLSVKQANQFKTLVEDIAFDDAEAFTKKAQVIKEHHFSAKEKPQKTQLIQEEAVYSEEEAEGTKEVPENMAIYHTAISKTVRA